MRPIPKLTRLFAVEIKGRKLPKGCNPQIKVQQAGRTISKTEPIKKQTDPNFPRLVIDINQINPKERVSFCLMNHRGFGGSKKLGECRVSLRSLGNM